MVYVFWFIWQVHLSFSLDTSGLVHLAKAEVTVELPSTEPATPVVNATAEAEAEAAAAAGSAAANETAPAGNDTAADASAAANATAEVNGTSTSSAAVGWPDLKILSHDNINCTHSVICRRRTPRRRQPICCGRR